MHTQECQHSSSFVCSAVGSSLVVRELKAMWSPGRLSQLVCSLSHSLIPCVPSSQKVAALLEQSPLIFYPVKQPRVEGTHEGTCWWLILGFGGTDIHLHSEIGRPAVGKWLHNRDL